MSEQRRPILVTGATGNTGRAIVDTLTMRGTPVRAMVRSAADSGRLPAGVSLAVANFDDAGSVAAALDGTEKAYLVTPSSEQAEVQQRRFADLAVKAGVQHLVVLSQLAADEQSPVRFLRYHAAVAAVALTEAGHEGATYTLTGPASLTHGEMAAALTAGLGRPVTFTDVPPGAFADSLQPILPPWQIQGLLEDYAHYRRGEAAAVSPAVAEVTGRPATDVTQFARDYAAAFTG